MTSTVDASRTNGARQAGSDRLVVVSCDSHVGPRMKDDLRPYCPAKYMEAYDEWVAGQKTTFRDLRENPTDEPESRSRRHDVGNSADLGWGNDRVGIALRRTQDANVHTNGHYDVRARLQDMDFDGVTVEVIFHGSQNEESFPFVARRDWMMVYSDQNFELLTVGYQMYNRWLADFCSVEPERHVGLAYLPMWDVERAVAELERAADDGLRGINLPAPRGGIPEYDDPAWEPLWSVCSERDIVLASHVGVPNYPLSGPQMFAVTTLEVMGWPSRRGMHRLIFGGVFERHPTLNFILTEQARRWWSYTMRELDFAYGVPSRALREQVPRKPSEYMQRNVFVGASFMGPDTTAEAIQDGYVANVIWGSDYPHVEGTYKFPEADGEPSMGRQYLRWAFADCPPEHIRTILGDNGIRAYHLDREAVTRVAERIGPTLEEVTTPLDEVPEVWHGDIHSR